MRAILKKYKLLFLLEAICILLTLPGCFAKEELLYHQTNEEIAETAETAETVDKTYFSSDYMRLTPGVYQVRATAAIGEGDSLFLQVMCDKSSFQSLRSNGVTLFANQEAVDFEAYVLDTIDNVYVYCDFGDADASALCSLSIYKTNWGGRILLFCVLAGCFLLSGIILFREQILAGRISKPKQVAFWVLLFSVLLAYLPYFTDYFSFGADLAFHLLRIEGLKETLLQGGQFPVRVQSYWLYDHGYAVSTFYSDFFILIPVLFRLIGFSLMTSYKLFVFLVMAATALIAYYSFQKCTKNTYAALLGSVIYVLAPYRIYNFYNRGAVGEYLAMVFLPLVFCGMYRIYTEDCDSPDYSKAKLPLIIGLSGILQSHLLTCEMVIIIILFLCCLLFKKTFRKKTFIQLVQAAAICLLINCWFWLPLLKMMGEDTYKLSTIVSENIQYMGTRFAGIFQLFPNMGSAQTGMYHAEPIQIGIASLVLLCIFLVLFCRKRKNPYNKITLLLAGMVLLTLFMSTRYFPWDFLAKIPGISYLATSLQFPTRLLSPASAFCAIFASFFFLWFRYEYEKFSKGVFLFAVILAIGSAVYHVNDIAYESGVVRLYSAENMGTISVVNGEYLLEGTEYNDYYYHEPVAEEGLEWSAYEKRGVNISLFVQNTAKEERYLELPLIGYPGYGITGTKSGEAAPYLTDVPGSHGDLRIAVPSGYQGTVKIKYEGFPSYRAAEIISLITLLSILVYEGSKRRIRWKLTKK